MALYRYLLTDLLTDRTLGELPLTGVSFERRISRVGALSATLEAPDPATIALARKAHDGAGRSALYVYRGNQLWWGGVLWTSQASQGDRGAVSLSLSAATFESYAHHRVLRTDKHYVNTDQGVIIPDLWRTMQADPRGNIGVVAEDQPTGQLRDRSYYAHELAFYGQRIEELGDVEGGPEHTIDVYVDGVGNRVKRLRVANRLGSLEARAVFQRTGRDTGRVLSWADVNDAVPGGTTFQARGATDSANVGEESTPIMSDLVEATDLLDAGWPLLDVVQDRSDVTEKSTLDEWAHADATQLAGAERTKGYTVQVGTTGWSPNRLGDAVRVKLSDLWHTRETEVRPVACRVQAPSKGNPESVELIFGGE